MNVLHHQVVSAQMWEVKLLHEDILMICMRWQISGEALETKDNPVFHFNVTDLLFKAETTIFKDVYAKRSS